MEALKVKMTVTSEENGVNEEIILSFDLKELKMLEQYQVNYKKFEGCRLLEKQFPSITNINFEQGKGLSISVTPFDVRDVYEFLHVSRPFFLQDEPASFCKIRSIFGKKSKNTALAKHLKHLTSLYDNGDYQPYFQMTVKNKDTSEFVPLFHDSMTNKWLNAMEYHQDEDKRKSIKEIEDVLSEKASQGIFVAQLSGRVKAISLLANLVTDVLKKYELNKE